IDRDVLEDSLQLRIGDIDHRILDWKVDQMMGPQVQLADTVRFHPAGTEQDFANLIVRFRDVPRYLDQVVDVWRSGAADGRVAPRHAVVRVIDQLDRLTASDEGWAHLIAHIGQIPAAFDPTLKDSIARDLRRVVRDDVVPAFCRMKDYLVG